MCMCLPIRTFSPFSSFLGVPLATIQRDSDANRPTDSTHSFRVPPAHQHPIRCTRAHIDMLNAAAGGSLTVCVCVHSTSEHRIFCREHITVGRAALCRHFAQNGCEFVRLSPRPHPPKVFYQSTSTTIIGCRRRRRCRLLAGVLMLLSHATVPGQVAVERWT